MLRGPSGRKGRSNACGAGFASTEHQARPEVSRERSQHVLHGTKKEVSSSRELQSAGPDKASLLSPLPSPAISVLKVFLKALRLTANEVKAMVPRTLSQSSVSQSSESSCCSALAESSPHLPACPVAV